MINSDKLKHFLKDICDCTDVKDVKEILMKILEAEVCLNVFDNSKIAETALGTVKNNTVIPIKTTSGNLIGVVELFNKKSVNKEFMELILPLLSIKIENLLMHNRIMHNDNYNNAMKSITKIIESQYELSYILPLIGEIMDAYIENHLVYIYLKHNNKLHLAWPAACLDTSIKNKISKMIAAKEIAFNKTHKIGYFPLINENNTIGCLVTKSTGIILSEQEIQHVQQLAKQIAITVNRAKVYAEILKYATLDALTGFYNRHQLEERLKQEISHSKRRGTPLCAIMTDLDFFKKVNDTYGHLAGDLVLKTVAKIIRNQLREYDIASRYGGEEFVIILPFTTKKEALSVAERLRTAVKNKNINIEKVNTKNKTKNINVTISIGITEYNHEYHNAKSFMMDIDKALYIAKESGRNRIEST